MSKNELNNRRRTAREKGNMNLDKVAYLRGIEDAAKVAETHFATGQHTNSGDIIAAKIRALGRDGK